MPSYDRVYGFGHQPSAGDALPPIATCGSGVKPAAMRDPFAVSPDYADLQRRVADLEERERQRTAQDACRQRLGALGFVFPGNA